MRRAAADRAPLRGDLRVVVVLVDFTDKRDRRRPRRRFEELFFSTGSIPTGSVTEYYTEVTGGLVTIGGRSSGPTGCRRRSPGTRTATTASASRRATRAPTSWRRTPPKAADADVDFSLYDNDGNGFVDAFIVVHAGEGAEETGDSGDIWSHKWVLPAGVRRRRRRRSTPT